MRLDGGHVALDFINTLGGLRDGPANPEDEHLRRYEDVVAWCARVEAVSRATAERVSQRAGRRPREAAAALERALTLRSVVDSVLRPLATGDAPPPRALAALAAANREAIAHASLRPVQGGFGWWWDDDSALDRPLWPLAHAAVEFVTTGPLDRLEVCGRCRWLFVDTSRNRSRRWCSMEECGTSVKKRRYVERRRSRSRSRPKRR